MNMRTRPSLVVFTASTAGLILNVDQASIIITLGRIAEEFGRGISGSQWILAAYLLPLASLVILGGTISDRYPVLRVFLLGLALFALGSIVSSITQSFAVLIIARVICGIGAAAVFPASLAMIRKGLPEASTQRAFGIWFGAAIGGSAIGPLVNGYLLDNTSWRIVFVVSAGLSISLVALVIGSRLSIPAILQPAEISTGSIVVTAGALLAVVFGLIRAGTFGWTAKETLLPLMTGLTIFIVRFCFKRYRLRLSGNTKSELGRAAPFIGIMLVSIIPVVGVVVILILYFDVVRDLTSFETGLAILPFGLTAAFVAPLVPHLITRYGFGRLLVFAVVAQLMGMAALSQIGPSSSYLLLGIALFSFGASMAIFPPLTLSRASQYVPVAKSGYLSGVHSAAIQVGQLLSIALIGSIANSKIASSLRYVFGSESQWSELPEEGYKALGAGEEWLPAGLGDAEAIVFGDFADLGFTDGFGNTVKLIFFSGIIVAALGCILSWKATRNVLGSVEILES
jgi:MFS family permease